MEIELTRWDACITATMRCSGVDRMHGAAAVTDGPMSISLKEWAF